MVRVIPRQDSDGILGYADGIQVTRDAHLEFAAHPSHNELRHRVHDEDSGTRVTVHQGLCSSAGGAGLYMHVERPESGDVQEYRHKADPVAIVCDADTAELLAIFVGELGPAVLPSPGHTCFRTACVSTVGTEAMAREDATDLGIFGAGGHAKHHLVAFDHVRDIETVRVYSPTREHRDSFAAVMTEHVDADITAVDDEAAVVEGADIVLCATNASRPVFDGSLLEPGQHVTTIVGGNIEHVEAGWATARRREIDDETVRRADVIATISVEQVRVDQQADLYEPIERGIIEWGDVHGIADVVAGSVPGRTNDDQVTLYKNGAGEGIMDVALATRIWHEIEDRDLGIELDVYDPRDATRFG